MSGLSSSASLSEDVPVHRELRGLSCVHSLQQVLKLGREGRGREGGGRVQTVINIHGRGRRWGRDAPRKFKRSAAAQGEAAPAARKDVSATAADLLAFADQRH